VTSARRAELFFAVHVRPRFRPGAECDERMLVLRDRLYVVTLALHHGETDIALNMLRHAADAAFLLHDFQQESDLLEYTERLRIEVLDGR